MTTPVRSRSRTAPSQVLSKRRATSTPKSCLTLATQSTAGTRLVNQRANRTAITNLAGEPMLSRTQLSSMVNHSPTALTSRRKLSCQLAMTTSTIHLNSNSTTRERAGRAHWVLKLLTPHLGCPSLQLAPRESPKARKAQKLEVLSARALSSTGLAGGPQVPLAPAQLNTSSALKRTLETVTHTGDKDKDCSL